MSDIAIRIENVSRLYRISRAYSRGDSLREYAPRHSFDGAQDTPAQCDCGFSIADCGFDEAQSAIRNSQSEDLSRVTEPAKGRAEPTSGRAVSLHGL